MWEWQNILGKKEGTVVSSCLHLSISKFAEIHLKHLDLQTIRMRQNSNEDTIQFFQELERQRMMASFNGTREQSNDMLKRYFCHMNPYMLRWFTSNKCYEKMRAARRSFSMKITSMTDTVITFDVIYSNEVDKTFYQPMRHKWLKSLETNIMFYFKSPLKTIFEVNTLFPIDYNSALNHYGKWYDRTNFVESTLPLFDYQKIMVKQLIDQEEKKSAISKCLQYNIDNCEVNVLSGFPTRKVFNDNANITGGYRWMSG